MPYNPDQPSKPCLICETAANIQAHATGYAVNCPRCGDFSIVLGADDTVPGWRNPKTRALASYLIRKLAGSGQRVILKPEFFQGLPSHALPGPTDAADNFLLLLAERADGRHGTNFIIRSQDDPVWLGLVGVIEHADFEWLIDSLVVQGMVALDQPPRPGLRILHLTYAGWLRVEELHKARIASNFAFFARRFDNPELDEVFEKCLRPSVAATGYELRTVPQRAGLIDAIVEDEIRRCRFLIADLSDDNAGAYWEAGFAEGLGKKVIYVCRAKEKDKEDAKRTHFDTDHRQTVRWDLQSLQDTSAQLKAVIRNTLLGEAKQED